MQNGETRVPTQEKKKKKKKKKKKPKKARSRPRRAATECRAIGAKVA